MQSLDLLRRSPTADYVGTVIRSTFLTPTIKSIWLRLTAEAHDHELQFLPGQSMWPKFEREGRKFSKIYSIASSPSHCPAIELCVSRVGWSSAYLQDLAVGDTIAVRGPYGLMTLSQLPDRPRIYLAEGSGIAPLKSQIDWLHECHFRHPVWLIQSNPETPDQLPYAAHWRSLSQQWSNFHYYPTTATESALTRLDADFSEADVEVVAVGDRTDQLVTAAICQGAKFDRLRSEKFIAF